MITYKLGIVGFGVVGKAVLDFFARKRALLPGFLGIPERAHISVMVWDKRELSVEEQNLLCAQGGLYCPADRYSLEQFLTEVDKALVSPGVPVLQLPQVREKLLAELDFFSHYFHKPTIAITGSLGKTTVTKLVGLALQRALSERLVSFSMRASPTSPALVLPVLRSHLGVGGSLSKDTRAAAQDSTQGLHGEVLVGGNIGRGMTELIIDQHKASWAVLELSSFQLELNKNFVPVIGVLTNLYPNHLDRHGSIESYLEAKLRLFLCQRSSDTMIIGAHILSSDCREQFFAALPMMQGKLVLVSAVEIDPALIACLARSCTIFVSDGEMVLREQYDDQGALIARNVVCPMNIFPSFTFDINWLTVLAVLDAAGVDLVLLVQDIAAHSAHYLPADHQHRMELVGAFNGVTVYNDSKSTVMESTAAAVAALVKHNRPIHLILGGLGKGVDRSNFAPSLQSLPLIKHIYSFGKERDQLGCEAQYEDLVQVLDAVLAAAEPGDMILFSPSGTSYDLFKDYLQRGQIFKELVRARLGGVKS